MAKIEITCVRKRRVTDAVEGLVRAGWRIAQCPKDGKLVNGQKMLLRSPEKDVRLRLFVYKVTGSGRSKPYERRIEITSTYAKGLKRMRKYQDVVLGYDPTSSLFVGADARRIGHGGPTGNASSFFDQAGLGWGKANQILVTPRAVKLFRGSIEYHAFLKAGSLGEYLFNAREIHTGSYTGFGAFSGSTGKLSKASGALEVDESRAGGELLIMDAPASRGTRRRVAATTVTAYEEGDAKRLKRAKLTPEQLLEIKRRCEQNGLLGEEYVVNLERKRLRRLGRNDLADRVDWVSLRSVSEGYDIVSFDGNTARRRYIEVKSTSGKGRTVDVSLNEWATAEAKRSRYFIYRVTEVTKKPVCREYCDPVRLEDEGCIERTANGWRVRLPE